MTPVIFKAIIARIEELVEGEGYWIKVFLTSGAVVEGGWSWMPTLAIGADGNIIELTQNDGSPPYFIPLSTILMVRISAR